MPIQLNSLYRCLKYILYRCLKLKTITQAIMIWLKIITPWMVARGGNSCTISCTRVAEVRILLLRLLYVTFINCLILALSWLVFGRMHSFFSSSTWSFCTPSDPSFSGITFQKSNFLGFFGIWCMLMELMEDAWLFATEDVAVSDTLLFLESYFRICLNRFFIDSVQDPFKCK